eukprot:356460-Chlamydomonas_euryale.AAC.1
MPRCVSVSSTALLCTKLTWPSPRSVWICTTSGVACEWQRRSGGRNNAQGGAKSSAQGRSSRCHPARRKAAAAGANPLGDAEWPVERSAEHLRHAHK